jgi:regulator of vacuolar morphogenesis
MTAIQAVYIRGHEERSQPKFHIVYAIEIQANVRSWQMWRRYSEFADLHTELTKSTGMAPPQLLPPKHPFSILRAHTDQKSLEERRAKLEIYLRAIISAKEDIWREHYAFKEFLGVPVGRHSGQPMSLTLISWLDEHLDLQSHIRDVRADINKRDALSDRGDVSGSQKANVSAKRKLAGVLTRIGRLGEALVEHRAGGMSEGELQRRTEMIARLQDDCEKLGKMVTVARMSSRSIGAPTEASQSRRGPAADADREALLGGPSPSTPITRVFGQSKVPQETPQTRPLDDRGLLQLQKTQIEDQDAQLEQLTTILRRQAQLGEAISAEISVQNEMLDDLSNEVDRVGGKLATAKTNLNRLG